MTKYEQTGVNCVTVKEISQKPWTLLEVDPVKFYTIYTCPTSTTPRNTLYVRNLGKKHLFLYSYLRLSFIFKKSQPLYLHQPLTK